MRGDVWCDQCQDKHPKRPVVYTEPIKRTLKIPCQRCGKNGWIRRGRGKHSIIVCKKCFAEYCDALLKVLNESPQRCE